MRLVCLSDTHGLHAALHVPEGDVLVHAGDVSKHGTPEQIAEFDRWLGTLPHARKVVVAGNHDFLFERNPALARELITHAEYLQDRALVVGGVRFYGTPWQPRFFDWAFNLDRGEPLRHKWSLIPADVDVLITHGPPEGILDRTVRGERAGDRDLRERVEQLAPRVHLFGHIHEAYGTARLDGLRTQFVNASICTLEYRPTNAPIVVDL
jgi:Icc-related predicted phosphoesterase